MDLKYPGLKITGEKAVVVGWSTGGTLALSLASSSVGRGIEPPDAILAFYLPTNYYVLPHHLERIFLLMFLGA